MTDDELKRQAARRASRAADDAAKKRRHVRPAKKQIENDDDLSAFQILALPVRTEADRDRRVAAMREITGSSAPSWSRGITHDEIAEMYKVPK